MLDRVRRRDLLKIGTLTTAASLLARGVWPPRGRAGTAASVPGSAAAGGLGSDRTLEALKEAVRWPQPSVQTVMTLTSQLAAARRDEEGYRYFHERREAIPDD